MQYTTMQIQSMYQKFRALTLGQLLLLIAALLSVFFLRPAIFPLLAAAVGYHFFVLRKFQKQYENAVTVTNLQRTTCKFLHTQDVTVKDGSGITLETLKSAGLMPCESGSNTPLFRYEVSGARGDYRISLCDVSVPQPFTLTKSGRKRVHFNSGVWAHIELPKAPGVRYLILDETSVPTPIRMDFFSKKINYTTASLGDDELAQRMVLYRQRDREDCHPSDAVLYHLKKLVKYTPGYVALSIRGNCLDIFVRGRFLSRPVSIAQKPTNRSLDFDPYPELSYLIHLADASLVRTGKES